MILEHLAEQKLKYKNRADYFNKIGFDTLAADFQGIIDLIGEMETYIKEKENGTD